MTLGAVRWMPARVSDMRGSRNGVRQALSGYPARLWWLGASGVLMAVGSLGVWAKTEVLGVTLESSRGVERLGWLALVAGAAASVAALVFARVPQRPRPWWPLAVCAAAAVLGAGVALYEGFQIASSDEALAPSESSGWGLHLTLVASVSLFVATAVLGRDTSVGASLAAFGAYDKRIPSASQRTSVWLRRTAIGLLVFVTIVWLGVHPMLGLIVWPLALSALLARRYARTVGVFLVALGVVVTTVVTYWAVTDPGDWDTKSEGLSSNPAFWVALTLIPPVAGLLLLATRSRRSRSLGRGTRRERASGAGSGPR